MSGLSTTQSTSDTHPAPSGAEPALAAASATAPAPVRRHRPWRRRLGTAALRLLPFVVILAVWEGSSRLGYLDPLLVPAATTVGEALWDGLVAGQSMWSDIGATLYRAVTGLVLGSMAGLLVGVVMGQSRILSHLLDPLISFAFPMPKLALLPLLILLLGVGDASKIAMVTLGAFFPVVVNTYAGVTGVNRVLLWNARTLGANRVQQLRAVVLPAALPHVLSGLRIASGVSFLLIVAAEMISANDGLGYLIIFSQRNYRPDVMLAGIIATATLGFLLDRALSLASRALLAWQDTSTK